MVDGLLSVVVDSRGTKKSDAGSTTQSLNVPAPARSKAQSDRSLRYSVNLEPLALDCAHKRPARNIKNEYKEDGEVKHLMNRLKTVAIERSTILDPTTAILMDRMAIFVCWPLTHSLDLAWPSCEIFKDIYNKLLSRVVFKLPDVCAIAATPKLSRPSVKELLEDARLGKRRSLSGLDPSDVEALSDLLELTEIEQEICASLEGSTHLTPVSDAVNDRFLTIAHDVCSLSDEAKTLQQGTRDINEAEARIFWDWFHTILFVFTRSYGVDYVLERESPLAWNDFFNELNKLPKTNPMDLSIAVRQMRSYFIEEHESGLPKAHRFPRRYHTTPQNDSGVSELDERVAAAANETLLLAALDKRSTERRPMLDRWGAESEMERHVQARVIRSYAFGKFDAGGIFVIPRVFAKKDMERVKRFSFITSLVTVSKPVPDKKDSEPTSTTESTPDAVPAPKGLVTSFDVADKRLRQRRNSLDGKTKSQGPAAKRASKQSRTKTQQRLEDSSEDSHWLPLIVLFISFQYKKPNEDFGTVFNQSRLDLTNNVKYLDRLGIQGLPVFAIAAVGCKGYLLSAWGEKGQDFKDVTRVRIADSNCPQWDLSNKSQALRLALFLLNLREAWHELVVQKFNEVRPAFEAKWASDAASFDWKMEHQKEQPRYLAVKNSQQAEEETFMGIVEQIKARIEQLKAADKARKDAGEAAGKEEEGETDDEGGNAKA
ncbi:uncharacterized protein SCHCODRAFT_02668732 [Schizophyllum commune H4-8]|uniref:Uncharacterized protein n=1 Tax=Schizophyllum commune (strain H4-8 / FGSC 9210) TaxID=578458 RepID=D8Q7R7_SCHCM|nr:uncharacterized protein SCHCODRAFT_02668732 [Schizophyllum commune H4-8]KAI5891373.1 hypothetical protein SCHCODRAFT_02668732 [Schizophyllum commune H4-8]